MSSTQNPAVRHVDFWYDRALRLWTVLVKDPEGNQTEPAAYAPNRAALRKLVKAIRARIERESQNGPGS